MSARVPRFAYLALLVAWAAAIALASGTDFESPRTAELSPRLVAAGGNPANPLSMSNSHDGVAILSAQNMKPGSSATGNVTLRNTGSLEAEFALAAASVTDSPAGGPKLSALLDLSIEDVSTVQAPTLYSGKLGAMPSLALGTYAKDEARTYRFRVVFPATASVNSYQGKSATVNYTWTASKSSRGKK